MWIGIVSKIKGKTIKARAHGSKPVVKKMLIKQIATGKVKAKTLISKIFQ